MSESHNKRTMVKLTPKNAKSIKTRAKLESKVYRRKISVASVANEAVEIGIKQMSKPNPNYK